MKRAHLGLSAAGIAALAIAPLALVSPAQASGPTAVTASPAATSRPDKSFGPAQRRAAIAAAKADRADTAGRLRLGAKEALVVKDVLRDTDGTEHVRYNRTYDGLPVVGGDLIVQQSPEGKIAVDRANNRRITVPSVNAGIASPGPGAVKVVYAAIAARRCAGPKDLSGRLVAAGLAVTAVGPEARAGEAPGPAGRSPVRRCRPH